MNDFIVISHVVESTVEDDWAKWAILAYIRVLLTVLEAYKNTVQELQYANDHMASELEELTKIHQN